MKKKHDFSVHHNNIYNVDNVVQFFCLAVTLFEQNFQKQVQIVKLFFYFYSAIQSEFSSKKIKCKTGKTDVSRNMSRLQVVIDDLTILNVTGIFQYLPDPQFTLSNESNKAQQR